jgi:hypothetical protein
LIAELIKQAIVGLDYSFGVSQLGNPLRRIAKPGVFKLISLFELRSYESQHAADFLAVFSDFVDGFAPLQSRVVNFLDRLGNFFTHNPLDSSSTDSSASKPNDMDQSSFSLAYFYINNRSGLYNQWVMDGAFRVSITR